MKHTAAKKSTDILGQIKTMEKDILNLKLSVLKRFASSGKKNIKLQGILKGIDITDKDILAVKKSLNNKTQI